MENTYWKLHERREMLDGKIVNIIYACSAFAQNGRTVIGKGGTEPWRGLVPSDMKRFQALTRQEEQNSVLVGRKTYTVSIPEKFRPFDKNLPPDKARQTIVLTRDRNFKVDDPRVVVVHSFFEAVRAARSKTVWVIGGGEIYLEAMPYADFLHTTMIYERFEGDAFFPPLDMNNWQNIEFTHLKPGEGEAEKDRLRTSYLVFQRLCTGW